MVRGSNNFSFAFSSSMKTTKAIVLRDKMAGGMVRNLRPDLIAAEQWLMQFNMRSFQSNLT